MAHRRDQVRLHVVEQAEAGDVLQHHRDPVRRPVLVPHHQHPGQERFLLVGDPVVIGVLEGRGEVILPRLQHLAHLRGQLRRQPLDEAEIVGEALRRRVAEPDLLFPVEDEDRIGEGRQRHLHRLVEVEDLLRRRLPVGAELPRHGVEGGGQLPQLVLGDHRDGDVEIPLPDLAGEIGEEMDRLEQRLAQPVGGVAGDEERQRHRHQHEVDRIGALGAGHPVGVEHRLLVGLEDLLGQLGDQQRRVLDLLPDHPVVLGAPRPRLEELVVEIEISGQRRLEAFHQGEGGGARLIGAEDLHRLVDDHPVVVVERLVEGPAHAPVDGEVGAVDPRGRHPDLIDRLDVPIVVLEDLVDRRAEIVEEPDRVDAHRDQQRHQRDQADRQAPSQHGNPRAREGRRKVTAGGKWPGALFLRARVSSVSGRAWPDRCPASSPPNRS